MKVNWILEQSSIEKYQEELLSEIAKYDDVSYILKPFHYLIEDFLYIDNSLPTIALCSIGCANELIRKHQRFIPGVFYDNYNFAVNKYYKDYYPYLLNKNYMCLPLWALKEQRHFLYGAYGNNRCIFVRPNSGGKSFTGIIIDEDNFDKDFEDIRCAAKNDYELVCISEPFNILGEWRLVIIDKKIVTGSLYRCSGKVCREPGYPMELGKFAENVVNSVDNPPMKCYTMDIAETSEGFSIVELNSLSCSGLYKCDISKFIPAVRECVINEYVGLSEDR